MQGYCEFDSLYFSYSDGCEWTVIGVILGITECDFGEPIHPHVSFVGEFRRTT
jgi:hypothetical protein